jgi:hypothetical protein
MPNHSNLSYLTLSLIEQQLGMLFELYFELRFQLFLRLLILFGRIPYLFCSKLEYCFRDLMPSHLNLSYLVPSLIVLQLEIKSSY